MTEAVARARVEPWLAPISDASPAGDDARYDPLHEEIRNEAAKLESASSGMPNWVKLSKDAERLTSGTSKDLLIESYAAFALYQTEGLMGLASGLFLLAESMDRYWEVMYPPARRIRARVNAVSWLTERLDGTLPHTQVGPDDHDAVLALDAAIKRLRGVVAEKFEDEAPALRPIADAVERLKMSLPERASDGPSDTEPPPPPPGEAESPAASPAHAAPEPAMASAAAPDAPAPDAPPMAEAVAEAPPAEPEKRDYVAELAERAKRWVEPIPGDNPVGIDAKYELEHEELRNDVTALDSPLGSDIKWEKVVPRAGKILESMSKDLLIASYLAFAMWEKDRLEGLAVGLEIITQICERYWEDCYPPAKRIRGRANALTWLLAKLDSPLPAVELKAEDKERVELLAAAVRRFSDVVRDKFEDAAPPIRPLTNNVERLRMSLPEPAAPEPVAPPPQAASPAAAPRPAAPVAQAAPKSVAIGGSSAALADPKDIQKFTKDVTKSLLDAAKVLREATPQDPNSYAFVRMGLALGTKVPAAQGSATKIPPPADIVLKDFDNLLSKQNWQGLLDKAELTLGTKRFWLDMHRYSALALSNLGAPYESARGAVLAGAAMWVKAYPELLDLTFDGGIPFASEMTREWISSEVMPAAGGGGGGGGGDSSEGADVLSSARSLAAGGKLDEALGQLDGVANGARSARARFRARLAMAQVLGSGSTAPVAVGIFESLLVEIDGFDLDRWEPELTADCYRSHLACLKQLKKPNDGGLSEQTAAVYHRLCRVDPLGAVKLAG